MFGLELTADNGNKFILPNEHPCVFYSRYIYSMNPDRWLKTYLPSELNNYTIRVFFYIHASPSNGYYFVTIGRDSGGWYLYYTGYSASAFSAYVFTVGEISSRGTSGSNGYGLQVFDSSGALMFTADSKPLRSRVKSRTDTSMPNGQQAYSSCTANIYTKNGSDAFAMGNIPFIGSGYLRELSLGYIRGITPYDLGIIEYIETAEYD